MTKINDLLSSINTILSTINTSNLTSSSAISDVFEAYVLSIVIEAAKKEGASVSFEDVHGNTPSIFVFRTSPGYISSKTKDYCHVIIEFPGKPLLEAHMGVRVQGRSGVLHECDIAVIDRSEAINCRTNNISPRSSKVILGIECKFYASNIPLSQARAFMGLRTDLSAQDCYFVINTSSESVQKYLATKKSKYHSHTIPSNVVSIDRLQALFQSSFVSFKDKNI